MKNIFAIVLLIGVLNINSMEKTYEYRQYQRIIEEHPREVFEFLVRNRRRKRQDPLSRFLRCIQKQFRNYVRL